MGTVALTLIWSPRWTRSTSWELDRTRWIGIGHQVDGCMTLPPISLTQLKCLTLSASAGVGLRMANANLALIPPFARLWVSIHRNMWLVSTPNSKKLGLRGVSLMAASGDSGANGRTDGECTGTVLHSSFPGSSPYITAVGATQLQDPVYDLPSTPA